MRVRITILSVAILVMPVLALAQGVKPTATNPPMSHDIVTPDQLVWRPLIPGAEMAVVVGDPDKKGGLCVIRIRSRGEVKVPPHWHVTDEHITVLEGSFCIGPGEQFDASKLQEMKVGAHAMMPAGVRQSWRSLLSKRALCKACKLEMEKEALKKTAGLKVAEIELSELKRGDVVDLGKIDAKHAQIDSIRTGLILAEIRAAEQAKSVLTAE